MRLAGEVAPGVRPVLHMKLFHPTNDHYGMSPLEAAAAAIDVHNAAARWNKALLDNSARPSGALVYAARDGNLSPEQYRAPQGRAGARLPGRRQRRPAAAARRRARLEVDELSPKDMDFIEAQARGRARDRAGAGRAADAARHSRRQHLFQSAEATRSFWRQTVLPLVNRTAKALSGWLAPAFGSATRAAPRPRRHRGAPHRARGAVDAHRQGHLPHRDEKRAAIGYGPLSGGDELSLKYNPD